MPLPESHLYSQDLDEVVHSQYVGLIRVVGPLYPHHSRHLLDHYSLCPVAVIIVEIDSLVLEPGVELLGQDGPLQQAPVGGVDEVTIAGHHEPHEGDAHTVLVEEDVWMRAGSRGRGGWEGGRQYE